MATVAHLSYCWALVPPTKINLCRHGSTMWLLHLIMYTMHDDNRIAWSAVGDNWMYNELYCSVTTPQASAETRSVGWRDEYILYLQLNWHSLVQQRRGMAVLLQTGRLLNSVIRTIGLPLWRHFSSIEKSCYQITQRNRSRDKAVRVSIFRNFVKHDAIPNTTWNEI